MTDISRRHFLRNASIGAAATGAAAAGGLGIFSAFAGDASASVPVDASPDTPLLEGSGVMAHVVDAKSGQITIFVGTREVTITNRDVAQQLLRAAM